MLPDVSAVLRLAGNTNSYGMRACSEPGQAIGSCGRVKAVMGMARQELHLCVEISEGGRTVAAAEVTCEGPGGTAWASMRAQPGHISPGRRASLVDAVLNLPEVQESAYLNVVFPLGDSETLQRLQERCMHVRTHPAGASVIMKTNPPPSSVAAYQARPHPGLQAKPDRRLHAVPRLRDE